MVNAGGALIAVAVSWLMLPCAVVALFLRWVARPHGFLLGGFSTYVAGGFLLAPWGLGVLLVGPEFVEVPFTVLGFDWVVAFPVWIWWVVTIGLTFDTVMRAGQSSALSITPEPDLPADPTSRGNRFLN